MKRVKSACLYQTLVFVLDSNFSKEVAMEKVKNEVDNYKSKVGSNLQILNEIYNDDGSIEIEVRKSVSGYSVGKYFG